MYGTRALRAAAPSSPSASGAADSAAAPAGPPQSSSTTCRQADLVRDDLTGLSLGPYELGRKIGGGGMGRVYCARHVRLDRLCAIKFIASEIAADSDAAFRFQQEVAALGKLQHPQIVNAVDAGRHDGLQYLVTELVDGRDLGEIVQRHGRLPVAEACELIRQAALGLAYAHRCGFVHRDVKPSNLILDRSGTVKLLDFGLVSRADADAQRTQAGELLGTLEFMAPEQAHDAASVDQRSDLYSLGCTLLYLLSGDVPFGSAKYATAAAKLKGHLFDQPQWLADPPASLPPELGRILAKLLAKAPADRYQDASEVATALAPWAKGAQVAVLLDPAVRVAALPPSASAESSPQRRPLLRCAVALLAGAAALAAGAGVTRGLSRPGAAPQAVVAPAALTPSAATEAAPPPPDVEHAAPSTPIVAAPVTPTAPPPRTESLVTQEPTTTASATPLQLEGRFSGMRRPRRVSDEAGSDARTAPDHATARPWNPEQRYGDADAR